MKPSDDFLDTLATQINSLVNNGKQAGSDLRKNLDSLIQSQLAKLDVVSREEFDAQQAVLENARTQIEHLKNQLQELETSVSELIKK